MQKCIKLAQKSAGRVSPNPLVGAVIFDDDLRIISQGRHEYYGGNHAERNAILTATEDLKGKSIIVNLEPCSHYGKTPPCADLIIERGIKRVISGMVDPNPKVSGRGHELLRQAGIEVIEGVLEEECLELNKFFVKNQTKNLPYIAVKTAVTLDGRIATKTHQSKWITDEASRAQVQKLRNAYDAILTGSGTIKYDNPSLTCRMKGGRNPVRVVLDTNLSTDENSKVYADDGAKVIIITGENVSKSRIKQYASHIKIEKCRIRDGIIDIEEAVKILYETGIRSIMTECGGLLNKSIIEAKLADELIQFVAPKILGDESAKGFAEGFHRSEIKECNKLKIVSTKVLKNDIIIKSRFDYTGNK